MMRNHNTGRVLFAAAASLFLTTPLAAQQASGKIAGTVTDSSGAVIPGVSITATNTQTGDVRRTETNASGVYVVSPLPVGAYRLEARKEGFKSLAREGLRIDVNAAPTLDLELGVGNINERVSVTAEAPTISTESAAVGNSRYEVQLRNLPTNVREVQALVGQTAGVPFATTDTVGGNFAQGSRSAMQVMSDGAQLNSFQTTAWPSIDGIGRRADLLIPSTEAIAEVRWVTSGGSAEYAQPTQVIIASKAGSNELHANAWEDYRSGGLGARRWEAAQRESYVRHQYGGTAGGRIVKDKMFFFGGIDVFSHTLGALVNARQPTAAERIGNLSGLLQRTDAAGRPAPITLYDPLTGNPFPNNVLPQDRLSPVSTELLKLIPAAPAPSGNLSAFNAVILKPEYDKSQKYDARWDYNMSYRDRLFARTTIGHLDQASRFSGSVPGFYGYSTKKEWTFLTSSNWTRILNPTTVAVFQFTFRSEPFKNIPSGGDTTFPVPIANLSPKPPFGGAPAILINSNGLGISDLFDRLLFNYSADYAYAFDPSITKTVRNHTFKAGFTFLRGYKTQELASPPYGRYQTTSDFNNAKSTTSATGDAYADFLLGFPSSTDVTVGPAGGFVSKTNYAAYIQDDWKVTPKLTLNLGLRYDHFGFFEEMNKRSGKGDFALGKVVIQQGGEANIQQLFQQFTSLFITADKAGLPNTFVHPNNRDFVPRLGAAYRVTPTFVVRGGFGIYAVDITHNAFADQYNQPPFVYKSGLSRSVLISQGVSVNSLFTFQNPTANGSTANASAALAAIGGFSDDYPTMKTYTTNVTVEKDLGHATSLRVTYMNNQARHLSRTAQVNACVPGPVQCLSRATNDPTARKWTTFNTNFGQQTANGTSHFNTGEIELIKRFAGGLLFDVNYAHSRLLALNATATNPVAAPTWSYDYGPVSAQPNDIFHWNFVWDVPVGKGRRFASHLGRAADAVLGGWLLSGLGTWQSGQPLTVTAANGTTPSGATSNRADRVANGSIDNPATQQWFDITAYRLPAFIDASQARPVRQFGTTGIGTVYGPRVFSYDMTIQKRFNLGERLKLSLRAMAYNVFNHPLLGNPDLEVTSATFGQIRNSLQPTGTAAGASTYLPRSVQLGVRFEF